MRALAAVMGSARQRATLPRHVCCHAPRLAGCDHLTSTTSHSALGVSTRSPQPTLVGTTFCVRASIMPIVTRCFLCVLCVCPRSAEDWVHWKPQLCAACATAHAGNPVPQRHSNGRPRGAATPAHAALWARIEAHTISSKENWRILVQPQAASARRL